MNEFVQMCDCQEIQRAWEPKVGDTTDFGFVTAVEMSCNGLHIWSQGAETLAGSYIWLPRLDQIIAMLPGGWGWGPIREFLLHWDVGVRRDFKIYSYTGPTFEHAALQAVMYARHGQQWDAGRKAWE